jgi:hypothetical protein
MLPRAMTKGEPLDRQLNLRVSASELDRLDRVADVLSRRTLGVAVNRSAMARAVILRGLEAIEAELAEDTKKKPTPKS